ncbi:hypothetical protein COCNU_scaffold001515G000040 [Cocos nucifera]|nr:hypothetical protein [Cocos nucifera]
MKVGKVWSLPKQKTDAKMSSTASKIIVFCSIKLCGAQQSGDLGSSSEALDGILGFGQSNSSMISQLAAAGRVRKEGLGKAVVDEIDVAVKINLL